MTSMFDVFMGFGGLMREQTMAGSCMAPARLVSLSHHCSRDSSSFSGTSISHQNAVISSLSMQYQWLYKDTSAATAGSKMMRASKMQQVKLSLTRLTIWRSPDFSLAQTNIAQH